MFVRPFFYSLKEAAFHIGLITNFNQDCNKLRKMIEKKTNSQDARVNKYDWIKLESCGTLVYPNGNRVSVEKEIP